MARHAGVTHFVDRDAVLGLDLLEDLIRNFDRVDPEAAHRHLVV